VTDTTIFADLIGRVRAGDTRATAELMRDYEPYLRMAIRVRLKDPKVRRILDSGDICQSVMASFFLRAAHGEYDLNNPGQLIRLLVTMGRNKLVAQVEKERAQRRGGAALPEPLPEGNLVADDPSPSDQVAFEELQARFRSRLTPLELRIAELRGQDRSWAEVAAEVGGNADGVRIGYTRSLNRIVRELGLDE
jgi:RNA polymerase sigma-70 factor (ECF subfamily)